MVKINKVYTKTGDDGSTGLGTGDRVAKHDSRVEAYGQVDEVNAVLGLAAAHPDAVDLRPMLAGIQNDLFDVGADLCVPITPGEGTALRVREDQIERLEAWIDESNDALRPLTSFVLPGGSELSARLHVARTVCRRAERACALLLERDPERTSALVLTYLNRLSDLLFVLGRRANDDGRSDVLWTPGGENPAGNGGDA